MDTTTSPKPDRHFLVSNPAYFIALGFGAGLISKAPGTVGTLWAWILYDWFFQQTPFPIALLFFIGCYWVGIRCCEKTGLALGAHDHGSIVWDEMVAFWLLLLFLPGSWLIQAMAFILFRILDIWKPWPIRWVDAHWKNAAGVMADDLLAAAIAHILLWVVLLIFVIVLGVAFFSEWVTIPPAVRGYI